MSEYLAQYKIKGYRPTEYGYIGSMCYEEKRDYKLSAVDENMAKTMVKEERNKIARELIGTSVILESLLEVKEIDIN